MSSWWAAIHGYAVPELDAALAAQLGDMAHVMFGGLTHAPAVRLAERLVEIAPDGLEHVFLADSGSVSVEVALKMVLQHQRGVGRPERTRMLTVRGGYHGDTFGCMSVCDPVGGMHSMFSRDAPPAGLRRPAARAAAATSTAGPPGFRALAAAHAHELAGIIVEPLLQGAGGMYVYDAACLRVLREVADEHGLVLVFDEIATGFGRTGTIFAAEAAGVTPDIMCVGKALTGGYLTLAAVLCTGEVARGSPPRESGVLMHGPTYMGNPLACAVALASLDLLESLGLAGRRGPDRRRPHAPGSSRCRDLPGVADVRTIGAVGVVQLDHPVDVVKATDAAVEEGVWLRPFRDLVYTMPPYVTSDDDVARICRGDRAGGGRSDDLGRRGWPQQADAATTPGCAARCCRAAATTGSSTWPATTTSGCPATRSSTAAAADGRAAVGRRRRGVPAGHRHARPARRARGRARRPTPGSRRRWSLAPATTPTSPWSPRSPTATPWSSPTRTSTPRWSTRSGCPGPRSRSCRTATWRRYAARSRAPTAGGPWCWPSRSTRCSATRPRSSSWPTSAPSTTRCWSSTRRTGSACTGPGWSTGSASPGCRTWS